MHINELKLFPTRFGESLPECQADQVGPSAIVYGLRDIEAGRTKVLKLAFALGGIVSRVERVARSYRDDGRPCYRFCGKSDDPEGVGSFSVPTTPGDDCDVAMVAAALVHYANGLEIFRLHEGDKL